MQQVYRLPKELSFDTVKQTLKSIESLFQQSKVTEIHLQGEDVARCDSAGLALLVEAKRLSKRWNKPLGICQLSQAVLAWAKFCGVEVLFND